MKGIKDLIGFLTFLEILFLDLKDRVYRVFFSLPKSGRISSYPLLSCDTYALNCDLELSLKNIYTNLDLAKVVYVNYLNLDELLKYLETSKKKRNNSLSLIIGDSDACPSKEELTRLRYWFKKLYCVNLPVEIDYDFARAIPLGLESPRYRSAGRPDDFTKLPNLDLNTRPISILICWNDHTNVVARRQARQQLSTVEQALEVQKRISGPSVHTLMRKSMFVACPVGNGLDTHRFWESLYLGAVPIVKRGEIAKAQLEWPHYVVEEWKNLNSLSLLEFQLIYKHFHNDLQDFRKKSRFFLEKMMNNEL